MRLHPFRDTFLSRHHLTPKCRKGTNKPSNILMLWRDKHDCWHRLFYTMTLDEIINSLPTQYSRYLNKEDWKILFGNKSKKEVRDILWRIKKIKRNVPKCHIRNCVHRNTNSKNKKPPR